MHKSKISSYDFYIRYTSIVCVSGQLIESENNSNWKSLYNGIFSFFFEHKTKNFSIIRTLSFAAISTSATPPFASTPPIHDAKPIQMCGIRMISLKAAEKKLSKLWQGAKRWKAKRKEESTKFSMCKFHLTFDLATFSSLPANHLPSPAPPSRTTGKMGVAVCEINFGAKKLCRWT